MHDAELDRDLIAHNLRAEVSLHADEPPAVAARDDLVCQELLRDVLDALAGAGRGEERRQLALRGAQGLGLRQTLAAEGGKRLVDMGLQRGLCGRCALQTHRQSRSAASRGYWG